ncbi:PRKCA-binding protein-like isoform X2 [Halichondria panicea]|uniref:PRKCA-binding protein-like isoform X2 n=1 Tax=Halichondria panicea TaxID=6063 RepID=UPI00312B3320
MNAPCLLISTKLFREIRQFHLQCKRGSAAMSKKVTLVKGKNNMIGISIGGGAPMCPVLYVVQVFHRTPAYDDGSLCPGDELVSVNGVSLKGLSRKQTADVIQAEKGEITIVFNKIEPPKGKSMDIAMKKVKHRIVEKMNESTADSLGLSRAVLVNDKLVAKVDALEKNAKVYKGIAEQARSFLIGVKELTITHRKFGDVFSRVGVYEIQQSASLAFSKFGTAHKTMADEGMKFIVNVGPMLRELYTFLEKAVPDTRLTLKKYTDAKVEFLAYCLKVKEMDDEEYEASSFGQPLVRVLNGNEVYRVFLRCRHAAKLRFIKLRSDVLVKLQLLDNKRVQDVAFQLERLVAGMYVYYRQCHKIMTPACVFPIEVELGINLDPYRYESHDPPPVSPDINKPEDIGVDDLLLPSLATPTGDMKPHPPSSIDELLSLPQSSEP